MASDNEPRKIVGLDIGTNKVVAIVGEVNIDGDLTQAQWQELSIDLASLGINLYNVTTMTIGFDRAGANGGMGTIFLDDIQLYTPLNDQAIIAARQEQ